MGKILGLGFFFLLTLGVNLGFLLPWLVNDLGDLGLLLLPVDLAVFGALGVYQIKAIHRAYKQTKFYQDRYFKKHELLTEYERDEEKDFERRLQDVTVQKVDPGKKDQELKSD
jgi:hypothetical protein